jgi:biopolymer transport protein ExbB
LPDLSPYGMFMTADPVVKAVMLLLMLASLASWTVWIAKSLELRAAKRRARAAGEALKACRSLDEAVRRLGDDGPVPAMACAAAEERDLSLDGEGAATLDRMRSRLDSVETLTRRRIGRQIGLLATNGATAPFIGLFGTVWGIMNSFLGIAKTHTTSLAVVAPGIAEALLATAAGLIAAVPAVIMYNFFARATGDYRVTLADAAARVLRLASRDLDREGGVRSSLAKAAE